MQVTNQKDGSDSILENILDLETESLIQNFNPRETLTPLLDSLREREKDILIERFGLKTGEIKTLQAIGEVKGITRERVRQIVSNALKKLVKKIQEKEFKSLRELLVESIRKNSGIITEEKLLNIILSASEENDVNKNAVRLLLELEEEIEVIENHPELLRTWAVKSTPKELVLPAISKFQIIMEEHREIIGHDELINKFKKDPFYGKNKLHLNPNFMLACLESGHKLIEVEENRWGLKTWREVEPKSVRDVILLEMRRDGKPMHFTEIAKKVNHSKFARKATEKTVHNELIRDPRIVLIGRGKYALKEWGYEKGTVAEIIEKLLKKQTSLSETQIVEEVLTTREVKKNTVIFNLRNNQKFKKDKQGKYSLKTKK